MRDFTQAEIEQLVWELGPRRVREILAEPELSPTERWQEHVGIYDDAVAVAKNMFRRAQVEKAMFGRTVRCARGACDAPMDVPGYCAKHWAEIQAAWS